MIQRQWVHAYEVEGAVLLGWCGVNWTHLIIRSVVRPQNLYILLQTNLHSGLEQQVDSPGCKSLTVTLEKCLYPYF